MQEPQRLVGEPWLTVVIPAYNEEQRLPDSLTHLRAYLETTGKPHEVIVVDDGSTDGTAAVVKGRAQQWPALRLVRSRHGGKGAAIRLGVLAARGVYVMLADADFSMPVEEIARFDAAKLGPYDLAIGSREATGSRRIGEPLYRHLMGRAFNRLVQMLLLPGIQDTQCGFKCLRREVAVELCAQQTIRGWGFDPELLYLARSRRYTIVEVPVTWRYVSGSKVRPLRNTLTMLADLVTIRVNDLRGAYRQRDTSVARSGAQERG